MSARVVQPYTAKQAGNNPSLHCNCNACITPGSILECPPVQHRFSSGMAQSTSQRGYDAANDYGICCTQSRSAHQLDGFGIDRSHVVKYKASGDVRLLCCQCCALSADMGSSAQWSSFLVRCMYCKTVQTRRSWWQGTQWTPLCKTKSLCRLRCRG